MNIEQAKEVLGAIGYQVATDSDDWYDVIEELHQNYKTMVVGSSMGKLGDAGYLYMRSGNAAVMVDSHDDLHTACLRIKNRLDAKKAAEPVVIPSDEYAFNLKTIKNALDKEVDYAERLKRDLSAAPSEYLTANGLLRNTQQVMDDLLSDDKKLNAKAVEAIKTILIIKRA